MMRSINRRAVVCCVPILLAAAAVSAGGGASARDGTGSPNAKGGPDVKLEKVDTGRAFGFRLEVLEWRLTAEEMSLINRSGETSDVAALAGAVVQRGDARVKYSLGGPVTLDEGAKFKIGHRVPFVTSSNVSKSGQRSSSVNYEDVGCVVTVVNVTPRAVARSGGAALIVDLGVQLSTLNPESAVEIGPDLKAPIFSNLSHGFTAHVVLGEDVYFWAFADMEQVDDRAGGGLAYVYRFRFDPAPTG